MAKRRHVSVYDDRVIAGPAHGSGTPFLYRRILISDEVFSTNLVNRGAGLQ